MTTLVACAHGTSDDAGRRAIAVLVEQTRRLLPGIRVEEAFVDVQQPEVSDVVARHIDDGPVVVVPLLLSTGFHTNVDIAAAVRPWPGRAIAAPALGPHDTLAELIGDRLVQAGATAADAVVLAAAGSSDPAAAVDVTRMAAMLERLIDRQVAIGFAAGAGPRIADVADDLRRAGHSRIALASYVLAPGHFARVIAAVDADVVTEPLAPDERIAAVIAERFDTARALLRGPRPPGR